MVVMMDGTDTIYGPQVAAALFGYLMGMIGAITSYVAGTHVVRCFHSSGNGLEERLRNDAPVSAPVLHWRTAVVLVMTCTALMAGLLLGDFYFHLQLYRELWMTALLSPLGALLRWNLMKWNASSKGGFPWGTWSANFIAALVCSFVTAMSTYVVVMSEDSWVVPALQAVGMGFAGSFSTVSSLVHEVAIMESVRQAYGYVLATIVPSMLMSLLIYVPIARFW
jgi:fluoride ion exporter CrcB/FEX